MARTKVIVKSNLNSWEEVNEMLRQIAEKKSAIEARTAIYNEEEAKMRKFLDDFCNPLRADIDEMAEEMKLFCEERRDEFGKLKSKELPNGTVGFRTGTPKVKQIKGWTWQAILDTIKRTAWKELWVRTKEEVNKEQIIIDYSKGDTDNDDLKMLGCQVEQEETFGYDVKLASDQAVNAA